MQKQSLHTEIYLAQVTLALPSLQFNLTANFNCVLAWQGNTPHKYYLKKQSRIPFT